MKAQEALVAVQQVIRATDGLKLPGTPSSQVVIVTRRLERQKVNFGNVKPVLNLPLFAFPERCTFCGSS